MQCFSDTAFVAATVAGQALACNFRKREVSVLGAEILSVGSRTLSKEITSTNDHEADRLIIEVLSERCPSHDLLTEEAGNIELET